MKITEDTAKLFDLTENQMVGFYAEIGELSKKKPDGPVSKFKVSIVNEAIRVANELLGEENLPSKSFREFDDAALPTASDVVLMISQYLRSMSRYRHEHTRIRNHVWWWVSDEEFVRETVRSNYMDQLRQHG